MLIGFLVGL